ncbi:DUF2332 family protein [Aquibium sp. A9E412]|uniref:DUF2332 domain-containing protein n=1 Tax=Aquibium sp. A9E412 TaxID=2976767 RepID=UPI0025B16A19|nr:DUF2332 family protein [Aquibium sp. A9E412]MDN2565651.1 DUF2332 family protein [Aquibium sp. A9E412]
MSAAVRRHFRDQAESCARLGSPFTATLCRLLAGTLDTTTQTGARALGWLGDPAADALALRLCGGFNALVLAGADAALAAAYPPNAATDEALAAAVAGALARHDARLAAALDGAPQTNEIARAAMLLPGFLAIGRETGLPLALHEIGSSAGLNLLFDRFHYRYGDVAWGPADSPVRLAPSVEGAVPPLGGFLDVMRRRGSDLAPIDAARPADRLRLLSYVWPDQPERLARLEGALALAAQHPVTPERCEAADFVAATLARRRPGAVHVLFHSIVWQYLPQQSRQRIETALAEAGAAAVADAPLAWLRMEPRTTAEPFAVLRLTLWPDGETRELARCDYHGRWIAWLGG